MKPNLTQAEVDALLGEGEAVADAVAPRDFRRPRRFGAGQLASISKQVSSCLPAVERAMAQEGAGHLQLSLSHIDETTRESLLASLEENGFFVQSFAVNGETGWIHWDPAEARQAVELSLGCGSSTKTDAPLSDLERSLAGGYTMTIARGVGAELGFEVVTEESYVEKRLLQASIDAAPAGDPQRLSITLEVCCEAFTSQIHLYLPGVTLREDAPGEGEAPASLPSHFEGVEVTLSAELATLELPLQDFLDIEEGDVIALGSEQGMTALLVVNGRPAGSATWGRDGDHITLRVEDFSIEPKD